LKISKDTYDELCELGSGYLNPEGKEVNNPKPLFIASEIHRPPSLQEQIQRVLRSNISRQAHEQGHETFEESQDFDVEDPFDSPDPNTIYQVLDEEIPVMKEEKPPSDETETDEKDDTEVEPDGSFSDPAAQPKDESSKE